jgi:hypothetical protein
VKGKDWRTSLYFRVQILKPRIFFQATTVKLKKKVNIGKIVLYESQTCFMFYCYRKTIQSSHINFVAMLINIHQLRGVSENFFVFDDYETLKMVG